MIWTTMKPVSAFAERVAIAPRWPILQRGILLFSAFVLVTALAPPLPAFGQCPINFANQQPFGSMFRTYDLAPGDFNGDGIVDLAIASWASDRFFVMNGTSAGGFQAPAGNQQYAFTSNSYPRYIAVGDYNQDGKLDCAVASYYSTFVRVYLGNGNGTFFAAPDIPTSGDSRGIVKGDFNADGRSDLAVTAIDGTVSILMGFTNAPGALFLGAQQAPAVSSATSVAVGDFNGDGKQDLAVLDYFYADVSILIGNGNGTFTFMTKYDAGNGYAYALAAGDFNEDGVSDVAVANSNDGTILILLSAGGGWLKPTAFYFTNGGNPGEHTSALAIVDLDNDGHQDIVVARHSLHGAKILRGTGNGSFVNGGIWTIGMNPSSIAVMDVNGDLQKDLVAACNNQSLTQVAVLYNVSTSGPLITKHPQSQGIWNNYTASLSISATNAQTYQWRFNGVNLTNGTGFSGVTSPSLTIHEATIPDEGSYDCVVSNGCGSVTSQAALIQVYPPCLGDFNRDGRFDGMDVSAIVSILLEGPTCYPCK